MQIYAITFEKLSRRKKTKRNDMKSHGKIDIIQRKMQNTRELIIDKTEHDYDKLIDIIKQI